MAHRPADQRHLPPYEYDLGGLFRARLLKAVVLNVATIAVFAIGCMIQPGPGEPGEARALIIAAILAPVSGLALSAALCVTPDSDKSEWLPGWFVTLPRNWKWGVGLTVLTFWLVAILFCTRIPLTDAVIKAVAVFTAGYSVVMGVIFLASYESENAFRSRKGLPPKPRIEPPVSTREPIRVRATRPAPADPTGIVHDPAHVLRTRVVTACLVHASALLFLAICVCTRTVFQEDQDEKAILTPFLAALLVAGASSTRCLSPDPRRTWSFRRPFGVEDPRAAVAIWVAAIVAARLIIGIGQDRLDGFGVMNWAHALYSWTGTAVVYSPGWVTIEFWLAYAAAMGLLARRSYESVQQFVARSSPAPEPSHDEIGLLLEAYEDGRIDRDTLEAELRRRRVASRSPATPPRTIDPD